MQLKPRHAGGTTRVLIVEDDASLVELIRETLLAEGFAVDAAGSSQAALRKARAGRYDILLLDLILPDADGVILYGKLKNMLPGIGNKTVFMSGFSTETPVTDYLKSLGAAFLQKPFRSADLLEAVIRLSDRTNAH